MEQEGPAWTIPAGKSSKLTNPQLWPATCSSGYRESPRVLHVPTSAAATVGAFLLSTLTSEFRTRGTIFPSLSG